MKKLASYVNERWVEGTGSAQPLHNPATEEILAETSTEGVDFAAAMTHARERGGPALRALSFAQRGEILRAMAKTIHDNREELIALAIENGGNTRGDAKFDIDGASATLAAYGELGAEIGDTQVMVDGDPVQIGRTARYQGMHLCVPRRGVAVHINAFNFPAWGMCEKAATALLAGMPVVSKPASTSAMVAHRTMELFVAAKLLPEGALSFIAGQPGDLLAHLQGQDVLAFTGSSGTARTLRGLGSVIDNSVHVNVEADSLNAAVLAPDVDPSSETFQLFLADISRDITQKAGQKCTAIRRIFVAEALAERAAEALVERLAGTVVGDPADKSVRMGPLASAAQQRDVRAGIERLAGQTEALFGGDGACEPVGVPAGKGYFVGPVLRRASDARAATAVHDHEVFGPVATLLPFAGGAEEAAELVALGGGGLVASAYTDERDYARDIILGLAPYNGRVYLGSNKMAAQSMGPGTVLPQLVHGGPGRAGGGEELGGRRGMALYQQRTAVQGDKGMLKTFER
ncbi:3,4-dehydroadipyl-CoA semialdehyde dehydrogenase [Haliangium ochraceum]|uniref:Aldehyde Dehydrogenase n=1 Tax=Haliangium ochraceum (strain DSM 14365 / JCM 11303 / SMP-2) TaxID=502025 RepID=D0LU69_HALO1|nr:3,4-dehydroadipyl-CoA semialdehyde dehydrogenase [Haliangium ochraceum]ACY17433.1 Aldehyde Dehydrogenase [Haliangium ochraceum DSM 14365]